SIATHGGGAEAERAAEANVEAGVSALFPHEVHGVVGAVLPHVETAAQLPVLDRAHAGLMRWPGGRRFAQKVLRRCGAGTEREHETGCAETQDGGRLLHYGSRTGWGLKARRPGVAWSGGCIRCPVALPTRGARGGWRRCDRPASTLLRPDARPPHGREDRKSGV